MLGEKDRATGALKPVEGRSLDRRFISNPGKPLPKLCAPTLLGGFGFPKCVPSLHAHFFSVSSLSFPRLFSLAVESSDAGRFVGRRSSARSYFQAVRVETH